MSATRSDPLALELALPWTIDEEREKKFNRAVIRAILFVIIFLILMQFLPVFDLSYDNEPEIVKTTLILEPREVIQEVEPEKPKPIIPKPRPDTPIAKTKSKEKPAAPKVEEKPSVVTSQGLDELSTQLASLTSAIDTQKLRKKNVSDSDRGKVASANTEKLGLDNVTRRSSGVEIDEDIMRSNVSALSAHQATEVEGLDFSVAAVVGESEEYGSLKQGTRDMESIRRTLESTKSRVYSIYQQALAQNPDLAGKFTFKLIILPDGAVTELKLVSSELAAKDLEQKILEQIRRVNFGAADVIATAVQYKFVFLPG